jgi:hypothetical protein
MNLNIKNTKQYLLELINEVDENTCIITHYRKDNNFIPVLFRKDMEYQIYTNMYSPFEKYEDVSELIDHFLEHFEKIEDKDEYYFSLETVNYFEHRRIDLIKKSVEKKLRGEIIDTNFQKIIEEVNEMSATYVISPSRKIAYLIGACESDEDYYYVYLIQKNGGIELTMESCVGSNIRLKGVLNDENYDRLSDYVISECLYTIDPKTQIHGYKIMEAELQKRFLENTEYVMITNIKIIQEDEKQVK